MFDPSQETDPARVTALLSLYLSTANRNAGGGKSAQRYLPNYAGFCRFLGIGTDKLDALAATSPDLYGYLCAVFEDEALNSGVSASVLSPYLKRRLGYTDAAAKKEVALSRTDGEGEIRVLFDHDILADGE